MWWYIGLWVSKVIPETTAHCYTKHTKESTKKTLTSQAATATVSVQGRDRFNQSTNKNQRILKLQIIIVTAT